MSWRSVLVAVVSVAVLGWFLHSRYEKAMRDVAKSTGHCMHDARRTNNPKCGNFSHHQAEHWMRQLGLSKDDTEFWWMHDSVDQIHGDGSLNLLEKYLTSEAERLAALRAAEESMMAWQVYFDGFYYEGLRQSGKA